MRRSESVSHPTFQILPRPSVSATSTAHLPCLAQELHYDLASLPMHIGYGGGGGESARSISLRGGLSSPRSRPVPGPELNGHVANGRDAMAFPRLTLCPHHDAGNFPPWPRHRPDLRVAQRQHAIRDATAFLRGQIKLGAMRHRVGVRSRSGFRFSREVPIFRTG